MAIMSEDVLVTFFFGGGGRVFGVVGSTGICISGRVVGRYLRSLSLSLVTVTG